ncbi:MAG: hypothetical protein IJI61_04725 [Oscillospiraceae bacterium]|nr:hypothetical protein [Oscillospiraceae bacterium]
MKTKFLLAIGAILAVLLCYLVIRILSGVFSLASGALNMFLGIIVIAALLLIVAWMFYYAKHH